MSSPVSTWMGDRTISHSEFELGPFLIYILRFNCISKCHFSLRNSINHCRMLVLQGHCPLVITTCCRRSPLRHCCQRSHNWCEAKPHADRPGERERGERTTGRNTMHIHNKLDKLDGQEADVGVVGEVSNRWARYLNTEFLPALVLLFCVVTCGWSLIA